ncbi:iron-sulfur cluster assembly scaffold protein [Elusimicrobiota bacterium]
MKKKSKLASNLKNSLEKWAEERLEYIGVYRDKAADYELLKEKLISDLRAVYSDIAIDLFLNPKDNKTIKSPDGFARIAGPCGDTMEMYFIVEKGRIEKATYQTTGCAPSIASGGMVIRMVKRMSIEEAEKLTQRDILTALGKFPKESSHCTLLALNTLKEAIKNL